MHPDAAHNFDATARLRVLVDGLTANDLTRPLGGGWTVAMALGHVAFWDGRQAAVVRHFDETGVLLGSEAPDPHNPDELTNEALEPLLRALEPSAVVLLAAGAADDVDAAVGRLSDASIAALLSGEHAYVVRRWAHREEHIEQILRALP